MRIGLSLLIVIFAFATLSTGLQNPNPWPSLQQQLAKDNVNPGSALAGLIAQNQDFDLLRPEEASDKLGIPPWLRVVWRKAHPQDLYPADDPTGGYPRVLRDIHRWMVSHQDLRPAVDAPSSPEADTHVAEAVDLGSNMRISGAQTSARSESDIRINYFSPSKIISASNNISASGVQAMFYSSDGGASWGQTVLSLFTGDAFHSDPAVDWTSDGTAWSMTLGINSAGSVLRGRAYSSTNGGATWVQDATFSGNQNSVDKELMWVDHSLASPFLNNIYVTYHNGNKGYVVRRLTAGWQSPVQISGNETAGTPIGADIKTNQAGDVFAFWPATGNSRIFVAKSTDGGATFGTPVQVATTVDSYDIGMPSFSQRRALIYTSSASYKTGGLNNVYTSWTDLSGEPGCTAPANEPGANVSSTCKTRIWFARSTNGGATWSGKIMINNQPSLNDQFNQAMAVDPATGMLGIIYYDTIGDAGRFKTDVWYQSSSDGGVTWLPAVKVTTAQTDETSAGADTGNQYGDYNALDAFAGVLFPSWTDRRNNAREEIWTSRITETLLKKRRGQLTSD
jgi:hypothetical protein